MHVDLAIPWSRRRSNDLWNLLPVESRVNAEKGAGMQDLLFGAFKDALEYTAVSRGVERW